jgi:hypothetical protein
MRHRLILALVILAAALPAAAGDTGLGIIIGEPTGLSLKHWTGRSKAIDLAAAWSFEGEDALHLHGDLLFHRYDWIEVDGEGLPTYLGVGVRVKLVDDDELIGARFPIGVAYAFDRNRFDFFFELVPIMDLAPDTDFSLNAGLGLRFWFD